MHQKRSSLTCVAGTIDSHAAVRCRARNPEGLESLLFCVGLWLMPALCTAQSVADCASLRISITKPLDMVWHARLANICMVLATRSDLDVSARVAISPGPQRALIIHATLGDGRAAERHVAVDGPLELTLEALLVLPSAETSPATPVTPTVKRVVPSSSSHPRHVDESYDPARESFIHIGLGVSIIGHVFGAPTYAAGGFAARASLRVGRLVLDLTPRWEAEQPSLHTHLADFEMHNFGLGAQLAVQVWSSSFGAAETGLGLLLLEEFQSYRDMGKELQSSRLSAQLAAVARLLWGSPNWRWVLGIEIDLAPNRLVHPVRIRDMLPELPALGIGIGFGAHWESG
jgi:hypothetical protein